MDTTSENIRPHHVPEIVESADLSKFKLGGKEAFLFSQIDGMATVQELRLITGMRDAELKRALSRFFEIGLARLKEDVKKGGSKVIKSADPAPEDLEGRVRLLYMNMENVDYYMLLGVKRDCHGEDIKNSYHRLSKEYHPDRLFRRGSEDVRERLQYIFAEINKAYKTLSHNKKRAEYDHEIADFESSVDISWMHEEKPAKPKKKRAAPVEEEEKPKEPTPPPVKPDSMKKPFIRPASNPFSETIEKARRLYDMAMGEAKRQNYNSAKQNLQIAITLDKFNKKYPEALKKIAGQEGVFQGRQKFREALEREGQKDYDDAVRLYHEATVLDNDNAQYYTRWARLLLEHKNNASQAKSMVQKAFDLGSNEAEQYLILGLALKEQGQRPAAIAKLEKGLEIDPKNKDLLKALKRTMKGK